jgi:hypothetical protein
MTRPQRIQRKRAQGWRMPANTVYVGRPTKWGNLNTIAHFGEQGPVGAFERDLRAAMEGVAQVEEPGERGGAPGARGGVALASAHPGLHGSAQMENPTKASTAKLRTIIASAATSMMENRLRSNAMMRYWAAVERPL